MNGIFAHAFCKELAQGVRLGLGRISCANDLAPMCHCAFPFKRDHDHFTARHEAAK